MGSQLSRTGLFGTLFIGALILLFTNCSLQPKRDNPADPGSDNYRGLGFLNVSVRSLADSSLVGVAVFARENSLVDSTDSTGFVRMEVPFGLVHLRVELQGYVTAWDSVRVDYGITAEREIILDALPVIDSLRIVSGYDETEPRGRPDDYEHIYEVTVTVTDPDGLDDIDTVRYYDGLSSSWNVLEDLGNGVYWDTMNFGFNRGEELWSRVGKPITVKALDKQKAETTADGSLSYFFQYNRLNEDLNQVQSIRSTHPSFSVKGAGVDFNPVRYRLKLVNQGNVSDIPLDTLVWFYGGPADSLVVETELELNTQITFWWYVTLYDPQMNWVRTRLQVRPF